MTNLFEEPIYGTVTTKDTETFSSLRVYISSIDPTKINSFKDNEDTPKEDVIPQNRMLNIYGLRWNIEVIFYQHKFFWSFGNYMVRTKDAIERYANFLVIAYAFICVLPFIDQRFHKYKFESPQVIKRAVGSQISKELFLTSFVSSFEINKNYSILKNAVYSFIGNKLVS